MGAEEAAALAAARSGGSGGGGDGLGGLEGSLADLSLSAMSGGSSSTAAGPAGAAAGQRAEWYCCAYLAPEGSFCQRANTLQGFADVNRCACCAWAATSLAALSTQWRAPRRASLPRMCAQHAALCHSVTAGVCCCPSSLDNQAAQHASCVPAACVALPPTTRMPPVSPVPLPPPPPRCPPARDVITPQNAPRVLCEEPNPRFENFVAGSVTVGTRANVAPATMVGPDSCLEERVSVKRSVVGAGCQLGAGTKVRREGGWGGLGREGVCGGAGLVGVAGTLRTVRCPGWCPLSCPAQVRCQTSAQPLAQPLTTPRLPAPLKLCPAAAADTLAITCASQPPTPTPPSPRLLQVVNSVLMDDVRTGPNCAIHNCVLSAGCVLGEGARLRDCQLAPGYAVPAGAELTEEVLPPPALRE